MHEYKVISNEEEKQFSDTIKCKYEIVREIFNDCPHAGTIATPYNLCEEMINQLPDLNDKLVLVLFNPEFYLTILRKYPRTRVVMVTGSSKAAGLQFKNAQMIEIDPFNDLDILGAMKMKFDVVVGNPPYQAPTKGGNGKRDLWDKFVKKSLDLCKDDGNVSLIHPPKWRKPEHKLFDIMKKYWIKYLEIHSKQDGKKMFGATTRYDWYILQKTKPSATKVKDEQGNISTVDLTNIEFIPNYIIDKVNSVLAKPNEQKCEVIYSRTMYGNDKPHMSKAQNEKHNLPCIYGMYKDGSHKYLYSSENKGHFGTSKVIISGGEHPYPYIDFKGKYGICNNAFAIRVDSLEEAENIKKAIESDNFQELLKATKWGNFQIEYKMFKYFKKDFWKGFV